MSQMATSICQQLPVAALFALSLLLSGCGGQFESQAIWGDDSLSGDPEDCTVAYQVAGELNGTPRVVLITITKPDFTDQTYTAKLNADATITIDGNVEPAPPADKLVIYINGPEGSLHKLDGDSESKELFAMGNSPSKQELLDMAPKASDQAMPQ